MPSKQRPRARRARRSRARKTKSSTTKRVALQTRARKRGSIPLAQLPKRSNAARDRSLHALAASRNEPRVPLTIIVKREGTKLETVKKYFPSALKKVNGRFQVTKSDRYKTTLYL